MNCFLLSTMISLKPNREKQTVILTYECWQTTHTTLCSIFKKLPFSSECTVSEVEAGHCPCGSQAAEINPGGTDLSHPEQLICVCPPPPPQHFATKSTRNQDIKTIHFIRTLNYSQHKQTDQCLCLRLGTVDEGNCHTYSIHGRIGRQRLITSAFLSIWQKNHSEYGVSITSTFKSPTETAGALNGCFMLLYLKFLVF